MTDNNLPALLKEYEIFKQQYVEHVDIDEIYNFTWRLAEALSASLALNKKLVEALKKAQHSLVTKQGCFASDIFWADRLPHLENGTMVEWQIDDSEDLEVIEQALELAAKHGVE
jgi:hypothetical protein